MLGNYVTPVPAQQRMGERWYLGSADAIYQSLNLLADERPDIVVVVGADHVYRMDFSQMVDAHVDSGALARSPRNPPTHSSGRPVRRHRGGGRRPHPHRRLPGEAEGRQGAGRRARPGARVDGQLRLRRRRPDRRGHARRGDGLGARHGRRHRPDFVARGEAGVYDFIENDAPGSDQRDRDYWRDVGTLDAYFEAQMDLISVHPVFNLYNYEWPIYTHLGAWPPAKFVHGWHGRIGHAVNSIVSPGCVVSGALVENWVLSPNVGGALLGHGQRQRAHGRREDRPARRRPAGDPRQGRRRPRGRPDRDGPRRGPRARLHRHRVGDHGRRQGSEGPRDRTPSSDPDRRPAPAAARRLRARSATRCCRRGGWASTSSSTGTTSSRCTATRTASTSSAGRCSAPGRRRPTRVEIGALVTCNSYRNPDLLADMARTVDHISDGRLILGIGAGWFERDYDEYGYDVRHAPAAACADLAAALPRIEARWAAVNPAPTREIPILIGGGGEKKTLRIRRPARRHLARLRRRRTRCARKHAVLDEWCAAEGRDPDEIERSRPASDEAPDEVGRGPARRGRHAAVHRRPHGPRLRPRAASGTGSRGATT